MMISKILIAIDGSAHSVKAGKMGMQIAAAMDVDLVLLHVVHVTKASNAILEFSKTEQHTGTDTDRLMRAAQDYLDSKAENARSQGVKNVSVEVEKGPIARTIVASATRNKADMIVIGSRGMGDLEGLLRGGVSHRVESLAKCPVLVVK